MENNSQEEKRLYQFSLFQLNTMAKGIQNTHSAVELFNKYVPNPSNGNEADIEPLDILWDWSLNWKTVISLNGGVYPELIELIEFLEYSSCPYPWTYFNEDESLAELITSIAVVLPERMYNTAYLIRTKQIQFMSKSCNLQALNWESYNERLALQEFQDLEKLCLDYGRFTEFEIDFIERLNSYKMAN